MKRSAVLAFAWATLTVAGDAPAQVRWDAELLDGVQRRVLSSKPQGAADAGFGPTVDVSAHVALLPLLRIGLYAHEDASAVAGQDARDLFSGGLDLRLGLPWRRGDLRAYLRVGLGEAGILAPGHGPLDVGGPTTASFVAGSWGSFTEVPLAVGVLYRVRPRMWLTAEGGARFGFAFAGGAYGTGSSGEDKVALALDVGVAWGR